MRNSLDELRRRDLEYASSTIPASSSQSRPRSSRTPSQPRWPTYGGTKNRSGSASTSIACMPSARRTRSRSARRRDGSSAPSGTPASHGRRTSARRGSSRSLVSGRARQSSGSRRAPGPGSRRRPSLHRMHTIVPWTSADATSSTRTKTFLGVLCLRLELELEAPAATWIDDDSLPRVSLRQLLNPTSGIADYGRTAGLCRGSAGLAVRAVERRGARRASADVRSRLSSPAPAGRTRTPATCSCAVSSTPLHRAGSPGHLSASCSRRSGSPTRRWRSSSATSTGSLRGGARRSATAQDVRGRYHPRWVGHRTLASTCADERRFWDLARRR